MRPVVSAMVCTVFPSASQTAIWLSHRCQSQSRSHQTGIDTGDVSRLGDQHQRGDASRTKVQLRDKHRFDVHHERRQRRRPAPPGYSYF